MIRVNRSAKETPLLRKMVREKNMIKNPSKYGTLVWSLNTRRAEMVEFVIPILTRIHVHSILAECVAFNCWSFPLGKVNHMKVVYPLWYPRMTALMDSTHFVMKWQAFQVWCPLPRYRQVSLCASYSIYDSHLQLHWSVRLPSIQQWNSL